MIMWIVSKGARNRWSAAFSKAFEDFSFNKKACIAGFRGRKIMSSSMTAPSKELWVGAVYSCNYFGTKAALGQQDSDSEHNYLEEHVDLSLTAVKRVERKERVQLEKGVKEVGSKRDGGGSQTGRLSRLLIKVGADESVLPILKQWIVEGNPLPKNAVVVALTSLKRNCRYKQALEIADYVYRERPFELDDVDHMYRLYFTGQVGSIEDIENCFAGVPSECLTEAVYNQLISCYLARNMIAEAENALEKVIKSGSPVTALPFNQFMSLYRHQRQPIKALELMTEMNAANVTADTRTYNILLSMMQKQGDADGVLRIYKTMTDKGVAPDALTYSLVAKAYMLAGLAPEAESVANEMQKFSHKSCHLTRDLLLTLYAEQGKRNELEKLWKHIESFSGLSARSYGVMIECLGKLGLIQEAQDLALKAERKKGKLVARIFNALLDVYARHGMMQSAEVLMVRIRKNRLRANAVTYRHLIAGYLKVGELDRALEYLKISRESLTYDHSNPWFDSFLLVLESLAERGEVEIAEHTFEAFTQSGSFRTAVVYNILLKAYLEARKPAIDLLKRMSADGLQPDTQTMMLLKEIESLCGDVKKTSHN